MARIIFENFGLLVEFCLEPKQGRIVKIASIIYYKDIADASVRVFDAIGVEDGLHGSVVGMRDGQVYKRIVDTIEREEDCYQPAEWIDLLNKIRDKGQAAREKLN